jgi:hypothetical protein
MVTAIVTNGMIFFFFLVWSKCKYVIAVVARNRGVDGISNGSFQTGTTPLASDRRLDRKTPSHTIMLTR